MVRSVHRRRYRLSIPVLILVIPRFPTDGNPPSSRKAPGRIVVQTNDPSTRRISFVLDGMTRLGFGAPASAHPWSPPERRDRHRRRDRQRCGLSPGGRPPSPWRRTTRPSRRPTATTWLRWGPTPPPPTSARTARSTCWSTFRTDSPTRLPRPIIAISPTWSPAPGPNSERTTTSREIRRRRPRKGSSTAPRRELADNARGRDRPVGVRPLRGATLLQHQHRVARVFRRFDSDGDQLRHHGLDGRKYRHHPSPRPEEVWCVVHGFRASGKSPGSGSG